MCVSVLLKLLISCSIKIKLYRSLLLQNADMEYTRNKKGSIEITVEEMGVEVEEE